MTMAAPRILILRTGHTDQTVRARHGDYDTWFTAAMADLGCRFTLRHVPEEGMGSLAGVDGVLVTGTPASVRDRAGWMQPLTEYLGERTEAGPPVLAVCFGAQLAADALGGTVERNPQGWEIGTVEVQLTPDGLQDPLFTGLPERLTVQATHEDHVSELPVDVMRLAGNSAAAVQAFAWGRRLRAVQFHPEADPSIIASLVHLRRAVLEADARLQGAADEVAARAAVSEILAGVRASGHGRAILANWVNSFVRQTQA
jgi:GMP synthase (glutamine-hydrolysing)